MDRRELIKMGFAGAAFAIFGSIFKPLKLLAAEAIDKIIRSDAEWKSILTPEQYDVLRQEGTESPFTSPLLNEHHEGMFICAGCGLALFPSKYKFESGTGWPSFFDSLPGHIETKNDYKMIIERNEYHCARCGGHHGHIFEDGPKPTGLRYCNNGVALKFISKV